MIGSAQNISTSEIKNMDNINTAKYQVNLLNRASSDTPVVTRTDIEHFDKRNTRSEMKPREPKDGEQKLQHNLLLRREEGGTNIAMPFFSTSDATSCGQRPKPFLLGLEDADTNKSERKNDKTESDDGERYEGNIVKKRPSWLYSSNVLTVHDDTYFDCGTSYEASWKNPDNNIRKRVGLAKVVDEVTDGTLEITKNNSEIKEEKRKQETRKTGTDFALTLSHVSSSTIAPRGMNTLLVNEDQDKTRVNHEMFGSIDGEVFYHGSDSTEETLPDWLAPNKEGSSDISDGLISLQVTNTEEKPFQLFKRTDLKGKNGDKYVKSPRSPIHVPSSPVPVAVVSAFKPLTNSYTDKTSKSVESDEDISASVALLKDIELT